MKKLSLILILCLISAFLPAFAEDAELLVDNEGAQQGQLLLESIGIDVPSYSALTDFISREDFLYVLMQLVNKGAVTGSAETSFEDVGAESKISSALSSAVSMGIVSKAQNFEPEREVLASEAFKMSVIALGYAYEGINYGGFANGYTTAATSLGITKNMKNLNQPYVTFGDFFILMKNVCETDIRTQSVYGDETQFDKIKGRNILTEYFDLFEIKGIIEADEHTTLYDYTENNNDGKITIDGQVYSYNGDYVLGSYVKGYAKEVDGIYEIVYIISYKTSSLEIKAENILSADSSYIKYNDENDKEYKAKYASSLAVIYNGKALDTYSVHDFEIGSGRLLLIDNNSDSTYDIIYIYENIPMYINKVDARNECIYDENSGKALDLSNDDMVYSITVNGEISNLRSVKPQTVANCYISKDGLLANINITSKAIMGKVTSWNTEEKEIYIDEKPYKYTEYFEKYYINGLNLNSIISAVVDDTDSIIAVQSGESQMIYGYLLEMASESGVGTNVQAKIFNQNGEFVIYNIAQKVSVDAQSSEPAGTAFDKYFKEEDGTKEQFLRFSLNSDGEINVIDTEYSYSDRIENKTNATTGFLQTNVNDKDKLIRYSFPGDDSTTQIYYKNNGIVIPYFAISTSTIIFNIVTDKTMEEEKRCSMLSRSYFVNDQRYASNKFRPYNVNTSGVADVLVFRNTESASSSFSYEPKNGLVKSVAYGITPEEERAILVTVYTSGNVYETYYITDESILSNCYTDENEISGELPISPGDYIRFDADLANEITVIAKDYDLSSDTLLNYTTGDNVLLRYYLGYIYSNDSNYFMLAHTNDIENITAANMYLLHALNNVCIFNTATKSISPATLNETVSYLQDSKLCSKVLMRSRWGECTNMVIYK